MGYPVVQYVVCRDPEGVEHFLFLQELIDVWVGEGAASKELGDLAIAIAVHKWLQQGPPLIGAVVVALSQHAALRVAVLIEAELRAIAGAGEVAVV